MNLESLPSNRRVTRVRRSEPSVSAVLRAAARYTPCVIVDAMHTPDPDKVPTERNAAMTEEAAAAMLAASEEPARAAQASGYGPWAAEPRSEPEPEPEQAKRADSYYPVEVPIEPDVTMMVSGREARIGGAFRWGLLGLAMFALVLGLLTIADRARAGDLWSSSSAGVDVPSAPSELPSSGTAHVAGHAASRSSRAAQSSPADVVVRGVDPSQLPELVDVPGVDVSTLPLAPAPPSAAPRR